MDKKMLAEQAHALFDSLTDTDGTLFHIMNARRENSAPDYNGNEFLNQFESTMDEDFGLYDEAVKLFRQHSVGRS